LPKVTAVVRATRLPCQNIGKTQKFTLVGVHLENLGLKESGFVEGQNTAVEYRSAEGQFDRFPALASELLRRNVAVLVVTSSAGARAAVYQFTSRLEAKRLGLWRETVPQATSIAVLVNPPHSSISGASRLSYWRRAMRCQQSMNGATSSRPAV